MQYKQHKMVLISKLAVSKMTPTQQTKNNLRTNRVLTYLTGFTFWILIISCDPADNRMKIINKTNSDVYIYYSCDTLLTEFKLFRNGYYKNNRGDSTYVTSDKYVKQDTSINIVKRGLNAWEKYIEDCPNQQLNLYVIDDSIALKNTDDEIRSGRLYRSHFVKTLLQLKKCNWTVVLE